MSDDLGFTWEELKSGAVEIMRDGRVVTVLRGSKAQHFLEKAETRSTAEVQQLLARLTGNYKRGNERG